MRMRAGGEPELSVSEVGLHVTDQHDDALIIDAFESGISYFSAKDHDGERRLKEGLGELRHSVLLGTRAAPETLRADCELSLQMLDVPRIGLLWVQAPSAIEVKLEAALARAQVLQVEGLIRSFGFALSHLEAHKQLAVAQWAMETESMPLLEFSYSLHEPRVALELFRRSRDAQAALFVLLPRETTTLDKWFGAPMADVLARLAYKRPQLRFLRESGRSLAELALKHALAQPAVTCALPPIYRASDLRHALAATLAPDLTREELSQLDQLPARA